MVASSMSSAAGRIAIAAHVRRRLYTQVHLDIGKVKANSNKKFSSDPVPVSSSAEAYEPSASPLGSIVRHGTGDSVVRLDVGGKEFKTLRSTVASNDVLASAVARAEANREFSDIGSAKQAIFIDRDPTHFGIILQHLRNGVEGLSYSSIKSYLPKSPKKFVEGSARAMRVQLPTDKKALRDIYVEAEHYGIRELQSSACEQSVLTWLFRQAGGAKSNPFDEVAKLMTRLRRGFVAVVGFVGVGQVGSLLDYLPTPFKEALLPEVKSLEQTEKDGDNAKQK